MIVQQKPIINAALATKVVYLEVVNSKSKTFNEINFSVALVEVHVSMQVPCMFELDVINMPDSAISIDEIDLAVNYTVTDHAKVD